MGEKTIFFTERAQLISVSDLRLCATGNDVYLFDFQSPSQLVQFLCAKQEKTKKN